MNCRISDVGLVSLLLAAPHHPVTGVTLNVHGWPYAAASVYGHAPAAAGRAMRRGLAGVMMGAALIFANIGAHAEAALSAEDGNSLYAKCIDQEFYFNQGMCVGYIAGISDAMRLGVSVGGWSACIPMSVTERQVVVVTKQFLTSYPERRQLGAARLIAHALADAFPCH